MTERIERPLPLHPMTLSDVLDGAFKLLRLNARSVLTITAVFVVPVQVISAFLQRDLFGGASLGDFLSDPTVAEDGDGTTAAGVVAFVATVLILPFVAGAISRVVAASYLGAKLDAGPALRAVGRRWWGITASWILVHLLEGAVWIAAAVLAIGLAVAGASGVGPFIPVIVLAVAGFPWAVAMMTLCVAVAPALVVEDLGAVAAVRRSARLLRPRFRGVLTIALVGGFLANILGQVLGGIPQIFGVALGGDDGGWLLLALGGVVSSLVTTPLVAIIATLVYFDGRIRREGFDLEIMAAEMAGRSAV